jgi:predicted DsbA family dithiol-disulfide isomerase
LDADEMQRDVDGGKYTANLAEQVKWAYQIGVSGVPTYVINDRYAVVGAQPYEVFKNALTQIMNKKS